MIRWTGLAMKGFELPGLGFVVRGSGSKAADLEGLEGVVLLEHWVPELASEMLSCSQE